MRGNPDAVIVGSGPNGLAAAVTLAAAGLTVQVIEGAPVIGGGCRTQELTLPGFRHDICSAVPSIALASPFFQRFDLKARGVRFARPQVEFAHPLDGGRAAIVSASVAETAARLGADGRSYRRLIGPLASHLDELCQVLLVGDRLPARYRAALDRYRYGAGICKVDFALSGPVPWAKPGLPPGRHLAPGRPVRGDRHGRMCWSSSPGPPTLPGPRPVGPPCGPNATSRPDPG